MALRNLVLFFAAVLVLAGCLAFQPGITVGSGRMVTNAYDITGFDHVAVDTAFQAEITAADNFAVEVTIDDNLADQLRVEKVGSTLYVGFKPLASVSFQTAKVRITLPALAGVAAGAASRIHVQGFASGEDMEVTASGASQVHGEMETGDLNVNASSGSIVALSGHGRSLRAEASGGSTVDLRTFTVGDAYVEASGPSTIQVNAEGTLNAQAVSASKVGYTGNPTLGRIN